MKGKAKPKGGDWIHLCGIRADCVLGVYPEERTRRRRVRMEVWAEVDAGKAAASDRIEDAFNYEKIEAEAREIAARGKFRLVETLAAKVAEACLAHDQVRSVRVRVEKPGALAHTRSVAVEVARAK